MVTRRLLSVCTHALGAVLALCAAASAQAAGPSSIAALGDSYSAAAFSGAPCAITALTCTQNSWSTGTNVDSHYRRLLAANPAISGQANTYAVSGSRMADLARQAQQAVSARAEYVTILSGLNDSCRESEAAMTAVETYRAQFAAAIDALARGLPAAEIFVASILDADRLRTVFAGDADVLAAWSAQKVCPVLFADSQSEAPADVERRARARQRVIDFNLVLAEVCAQYANCHHDKGAVFDWPYEREDFMTRDYFHPSVTGQGRLAAVTWAASSGARSDPPPPPPPPAPAGYAATVLEDAPASYWRLGEATGTAVANAVAGPAGTYTGAVRLGQAGAIGGDSAAALNGSTAYIVVPHAPALATGDRFTLEAWIKRTTTGTSQGLFNKGAGGYQVLFDATSRLVLRKAGIGEIARSTVALTDRTSFHHIAITKDAGSVGLYIDGIRRSAAITNRAVATTTAQLIIGHGSGAFNGTLDDVAIYNRALDAATIARHHAAATAP